MTNPDTTAPQNVAYGLQGGFLLQNNGAVTGQAVYTISNANLAVCDSGTAPITGTVSGQTITLTAAAGTQTFSLTGTLGSGGTITNASFTTPGGTAGGGVCGVATTSGVMSWTSVPPLTGSIAGSFHSASGSSSGLGNQDFPVTGSLTQGPNIGASNATVTGTLSFIINPNAVTPVSDYPCIPAGVVSVNGTISGNTVSLNLIDIDNAIDGQIGGGVLSGNNPVTFQPTSAGGNYVLQSTGLAYVVTTPACPVTASSNSEDVGYLCLALNNKACQEPVTLSPGLLTYGPQQLGTTAATQTVTLTNSDPAGAILNNVTLQLQLETDGNFNGSSDFNGVPNFTETDNCGANGAPSSGQPFSLNAQQSCSITISFSPQESCFWLATPSNCPAALGANLVVDSPETADGNTQFAVPITGTGLSFIQTTTPELDFSAEAVGESSQAQLLSFTNTGAYPVQILGSAPCLNPPGTGIFTLPHDPLTASSAVAGLQVVVNGSGFPNGINPFNGDTLQYNCDLDPTSKQPNFQISSDSCTGMTIPSQGSCSVEITYAAQPETVKLDGLDFFLELNTVQCWPAGTPPSDANPCEIDSGRFPVELKANAPSPLRMSPAAGLNFGTQSVGHSTAAQTITLLNDPAANTSVTFIGKVQVSGNYSESDDCVTGLAPGASCTLTVSFKPKAVGYRPGQLTINYTQQPGSGSSTLGNPQFVYLHGTGQ
jgi:hypothetical protein